MQTQQAVPRRTIRNRPYDLRKRVLLKNFLRSQNVAQNISVFNLQHFNAAPTYSKEADSSDRNQDDREGKFGSHTGRQEASDGNNLELGTQDNCEASSHESIHDPMQLDSGEKRKFIGPSTDQKGTTQISHTECKLTVSKPSIQSKLSIKKPYKFCRRKSLRDPFKKKSKGGITKAKHGYKPPRSPSKKKFNMKSAFSQMFSRKTNSPVVEECGYNGRDGKEHGSFLAKLLRPRNGKPNSVRGCPSYAASSDRPGCHSNPDVTVSDYNLRSVSRSVQTDFSMFSREFVPNRNLDNYVSENRYDRRDNVSACNSYREKHSYSNKKRRYSDSNAFGNSGTYSVRRYPDPFDSPRRMHNSFYCDDQYDQNYFRNPRHATVARSRSLSDRPGSLDGSKFQHSRSVLYSSNTFPEFSYRNPYGRSENVWKDSSLTSEARNNEVFSENFLNQRYGLDVQHRSPSLLPNPVKQVPSSVYRSSSLRESSRNSPLLRKNHILCRRTRSVSERYGLDRMASYYK